MTLIMPREGEDLMELAKRCDALYICPKDSAGQRRGPLVPYAGKDGQGRSLVGDIYFNFAMIEPHLKVVERFAHVAYDKLLELGLLDSFDTICGIPEGGRTFGQMLAYIADKRFVYPQKTPKPTPTSQKQEYTWTLPRFAFDIGEPVAFAEDVYNNFNNTDDTLSEIAVTGANVVLLVGALNRSPKYGTVYQPKTTSDSFAGLKLPVVAAIREPYDEYEQDDPAVKADVDAKNIEWNVKKNWTRLTDIMNS